MQNIKSGKRPKNPLRRRVLRDLFRDWKRYLMIFAMLVVTIGFVSGMYVANHSMMTSLEGNAEKFHREDGHFELSRIADPEIISAIESGEKADMKSIFRDRAYKEAEPEIEKAVREAIPEEIWDSEIYKNALSEAEDKAHKEIDDKIDDEYTDIAERYELDQTFDPVPVNVYELFFKNTDECIIKNAGYSGKIRVYSERNEVDLYDILSGRAPQNENEIVIDRMHADNAEIKLGDMIKADGAEFEVVGLVSFTDYITLYENNNDTMFDALTFDVGMVTDEGFERISAPLHANYAFTYKNAPSDLYEEKTLSDHFLKALITQTAVSENEMEIRDYVPAYANHAITFAAEDMGSDMSMGGVLLYVLTVVLAFIFAVSISSMLEKEASVIGTLRASGYTKGELLRYYMSAPLVVVILAAIVGNLLGYTLFKNVVVDMYYNSYSLPTYETLWTPEAFIRTTAIPFVLMLIINFIVIVRMLRLSPLRFLRHDLKRTRRSKAIRLPRWSFFRRFRLRVLLQNIPNYLMLFVGVTFVMLLLSMAVGMPSTLEYYQEKMPDMMFAKEQVILTDCKDEDGNDIITDTEGAEPFSIGALEYRTDKYNEEISVFGIVENSSYVDIAPTKNAGSMWISTAFADKYHLNTGDSFTMHEKYENKQYTWTVAGIYGYDAALAVFMPNDRFNQVFEHDSDSFSGYLSDKTITDIPEKQIVKRITSDDMIKIANQLDHSMGGYMVYFQYVCMIIAAIILYLLTKIIIEKNERPIAMVKILGYEDGEIARLYLISTAVIVIVTELAGIVLGYLAMKIMWEIMLQTLGGYFAFIMKPSGFVKEFVLVTAAYLVITVLDFIRIRRIPKVLALKNAE
ncbi:FtsX-like permease family protein [Ruminococcus flavefaciens]|uniref:FtsX-like permease family protein n=1 Tax=Ruminococcus flavefaciens TaxID=1265 RepID=UPI0026EE12C7|nr:FtsX-like permease family protein [Ruminococcus flavefaciens]